MFDAVIGNKIEGRTVMQTVITYIIGGYSFVALTTFIWLFARLALGEFRQQP